MKLTFGYSPLWLIPILLIAGIITWFLYKDSREFLSRPWQIGLSTIRFLLLSIITALLLQPLINYLNKITYAPIIAVVQDVSESLVIQKDSSFVKEEYPSLLTQFLAGLQNEQVDLGVFGFAEDLIPDISTDSLSFNRTGTNAAKALSEVRKLYQNQNLGAVVMISDGITTAGKNPLYEAQNFTQPVYTVLLGDTTPQLDVYIKEVLYNEIGYLESEMPIQVRIAVDGFDRAPLQVSLSQGKKVLDTKRLNLGANQLQGEVKFSVKPEEIGLQRYDIRVSRLADEITYRNNSRSIFIDVLETRVKIALFGGSPHPDIGAIKKAFEREDRYELMEFVLREPGTYYEKPTQEAISEANLLILHNYPQSTADRFWVSQILQSIKEENKPFMCFVGAFTDLRTLRPVMDHMALVPTSISPRREEITMQFLPAYQRHSTYTFNDTWLKWANSAPPLYQNRSEWIARGNAEVMATAKIKNIVLDYPVYALQNQLGKKNMTFLGENFWRMRSHSFLEIENFDLFDEWLFNNVKWLMADDDRKKFSVRPSKKLFSGDEPAIFKGQAYDDSYNPLDGVEIKMTLQIPDGTEEELFLNEVNPAQYFLEQNGLAEGTYTYVAEGRKNNVRVGTDRGQFSVGKSNVEHYALQADKDLMQQIALRTGGEFIYAKDLASLPEKLNAIPNLVPKSAFKETRVSFDHLEWLMVLLLAFMAIEWTVRKWFSLS